LKIIFSFISKKLFVEVQHPTVDVEQTAHHILASCSLYHPLNGILGLTALNDDTVDWLKTTVLNISDDTISPNEEEWFWQILTF